MDSKPRVLLLHDHNDRELARDVGELIAMFDVDVSRIETSSDSGLTLDGKEEKYLEEAEAMVFLLTPGCERNGILYPSPSVTHELGQAKQLFKGRAKKVIYLLDSNCSVPAIDQKARREFTPGNAGSVFRACLGMLKDLISAGIVRVAGGQPSSQPEKAPDVGEIWKRLPNVLLATLMRLASAKNGCVSQGVLDPWLSTDLKLDQAHRNLLIRDLAGRGTIGLTTLGDPMLSPLGWAIVRLEMKEQKERQARPFSLTGILAVKSSREPQDWP